MTAGAVATSIIGAITSGLTGLVTAIPTAIKSTFESLFFDGTGESQSVSNMLIVLAVFGGITLAFGLSKMVWHLVTKKVGA